MMVHKTNEPASRSKSKPRNSVTGGRGAQSSAKVSGKTGLKGKRASVKNQIRSVSRQIKKGGLHAGALAALEQRLDTLKSTLDDNKSSEKSRKNAIKYHKVRFFERVKLERRIQKLEKEGEGEVDEAKQEATRAEISQLQDDLQYVLHFPKEEKYVSIIRTPEDPTAAAAAVAQIKRLKALVHSRLRDEALLADADEGASFAQPSTAGPPAKRESAASDDDDFFLGADDDGSESPGTAAAGLQADLPRAHQSLPTGRQEQLPGQSKDPLVPEQPSGQKAKKTKKAGPQRQHRKSSLLVHSPAAPQELRAAASADFSAPNARDDHRVRERAPPTGLATEQQTQQAPRSKPAHRLHASSKQDRASKAPRPAPKAVQKVKEVPNRTRAEGGRKRRKK